MKPTYNIFSKKYWTKENLFNGVDTSELKKSIEDLKNTRQERAKKKSSIGWKLTIGVTLPILLTLFLGIFGLIIGIIIFMCVMFR